MRGWNEHVKEMLNAKTPLNVKTNYTLNVKITLKNVKN